MIHVYVVRNNEMAGEACYAHNPLTDIRIVLRQDSIFKWEMPYQEVERCSMSVEGFIATYAGENERKTREEWREIESMLGMDL